MALFKYLKKIKNKISNIKYELDYFGMDAKFVFGRMLEDIRTIFETIFSLFFAIFGLNKDKDGDEN